LLWGFWPLLSFMRRSKTEQLAMTWLIIIGIVFLLWVIGAFVVHLPVILAWDEKRQRKKWIRSHMN
jgi:hypothetical protein